MDLGDLLGLVRQYHLWDLEARSNQSDLEGQHRPGDLGDLLDLVINTDDGTTANHTILVGPRGIGKTHILCLLDHYVSGRLRPLPDNRPSVSGWISLLFSEEEYARQNTLANFYLALFRKLAELSPLETLWQLPVGIDEDLEQTSVIAQ